MTVDLLNYCSFILVPIFYVRYLRMSYECVCGWYDRYDIYVHIKFKCLAHNFTGRVIQSTGNGMGTSAERDHAHCFTGMTKLRSRKSNNFALTTFLNDWIRHMNVPHIYKVLLFFRNKFLIENIPISNPGIC